MHDIHVYFIFLTLAPSIYWASNSDFISYYAEYAEFCFFTKEPNNRCISGFEETCNIPQGDDSIFSIIFYQILLRK